MTVTRMEAHDTAVEAVWHTFHKLSAWLNSNIDPLQRAEMLHGIRMTEAEWEYMVEMVRPIGE